MKIIMSHVLNVNTPLWLSGFLYNKDIQIKDCGITFDTAINAPICSVEAISHGPTKLHIQ